MSEAPAGWYPQADGRQRYWDGVAWTEHSYTPEQQQPGRVTSALNQAAGRLLDKNQGHEPDLLWSAVGKPVMGIGAGRYRLTDKYLLFETGTLRTDDRGPELLDVPDHVVRREGADDCLRVAALDDRRRETDCRHRVTGARLRDDVLGRQVGQLGPDRINVQPAGDDEHPAPAEPGQPVPGAFEQGAARAGEVVEELRGRPARQGPQPGTRPAGGDHGPEPVDGLGPDVESGAADDAAAQPAPGGLR